MDNREELIKKLRKKIKNKRGLPGGSGLDINKLNQFAENFMDNGELKKLKDENQKLKKMLNNLMTDEIKEAINNYKNVLKENNDLKMKIKKLNT